MPIFRRFALPFILGGLVLAATVLAVDAQDAPHQGSRTYLPLALSYNGSCTPLPGESYAAIVVPPPPTDRPAALHADLNLALRGYTPTTGVLGLVDYGGTVDPGAPQLAGLFADNRTGVFVRLQRVYGWDWACNCRGTPLSSPAVTLAELATTPGETVHVPASGYSIGTRNSVVEARANTGFEVLVLYAAEDRITLKYTRNDNVIHGYTLHLEHVCVDPALLALYRHWNSAGRSRLPALHAGQAFARANGPAIGVAIRDSGTFLDPRSRKDWWQGR